MTEKAIPRQGMAIEGGGEVTSGSHVADARGRDRARRTSRPRRRRPGTELVIDVRGTAAPTARSSKKPLYKKEP